MPVPAVRTIVPENVRNFGRFGDTVDVPPLTEIQTNRTTAFSSWTRRPKSARPRTRRRVARNLPH